MDKIQELISRLGQIKEELSKASKAEPHTDDPSHKAKMQEKAKASK